MLGYALSSEEHAPGDLLHNAKAAEEAGFPFLMASDHFHPWVDRQGHSAFVWGVLGGIAASTSRIEVGTGVTCPTVRIHPAIIAQAAATTACLMPGRFRLGVGTGENLNEHILGGRWPAADERLEMLDEAIAIIRLLWEGGSQSHRGRYYNVENARVYDLPDELPPILVAASGPAAADLAGRVGDGLVSTAPDAEIVSKFEAAGGTGKPKYGQVTVVWAESESAARKMAFEWWPTAGLGGELGQELPTPAHFEQAAQTVREEDVAKAVVCGPDPEPVIEKIRGFHDAGFTHVYVHQVGPDQEGFFAFAQKHLLPEFPD